MALTGRPAWFIPGCRHQIDEEDAVLRKLILLLLFVPGLVLAADAEQHRDPNTGLLSWRVKEPSFSLQLVQVLPDSVTAMYGSRGLPEELITRVRDYCVFGTILTNDSAAQLVYRVEDWHARTGDGRQHPVRAKTGWVEEWAAMGVPFRWSMLADEQTFEPGDWMQGFTTLKLSPDTAFDFAYSLEIGDEKHDGNIAGVRCAPATPPLN